MKFLGTAVLFWGLGIGCLAAPERATSPTPVAFAAIDLFVDSGAQPLAAYQLEFSTPEESVKIVSIEGGGHPAFKEPPYYDPKAIQHERVILAAFNAGSPGQLPTGRTRVATIHVQMNRGASPLFAIRIQTAAGNDGRPISVKATFKERNANESSR